jgi:hypothetical protein
MKYALMLTQVYCIISCIFMFIITGHHIGRNDKHYETMHHISNIVQAFNWL